MALWADKHRPKSLEDLAYNVDQLRMLKQMTSTNDFPHLLFVGPDGCGKRTRMHCLLREIYGDGIYQMKHTTLPMETAAGKPIKITGVDSKYHIEVRPSDLGFHDRIVVQQIIKETANVAVDPAIYGKPFKVVVMMEADQLTIDAQQALRRTMEKYASSCKLFLCCTSMNKLIEPLVSRCMVVRLPAPGKSEAWELLKGICALENVRVQTTYLPKLIEHCDYNMRRCLLTLEGSVAKYGKNTIFIDEKQIAIPEWKSYIVQIVEKILKSPTGDGVLAVRNMIYELINRLIPTNIIFEYLVAEFIKRIPDKEKLALLSAASTYQHMSLQGDKPIIFLEGFLLEFIDKKMDCA